MAEKTADIRSTCKRINDLILSDKYEDARNLIIPLLVNEPNDHWLLTELAETYYEQFNYKKALEYSEQALKVAPNCPLALWGYAGQLEMLSRLEEAISIYKRLIHRGVRRLAHGNCGEGLPAARSLVNDCRYRLGIIYADMGEIKKSVKYLQAHISNRKHNCRSTYNIREVKEFTKIQIGKVARLN